MRSSSANLPRESPPALVPKNGLLREAGAVKAVIIVAGVNGSGKSTLTRDKDFLRAQEDSLGPFEVLNPDVQTSAYSSSYPQFSIDALNLCGVLETERRVWKHIAEGSSCLVETVLSSQKFFPVINAAKANGFRTRMVYCALPSVELAVARVELRVSEGGHDVPGTKIRSRWNSSLDNFVRLAAIVDEVVLVNNAGENPVEIGYKNLNGQLELVDAGSVPDLSRRLGRAKAT